MEVENCVGQQKGERKGVHFDDLKITKKHFQSRNGNKSSSLFANKWSEKYFKANYSNCLHKENVCNTFNTNFFGKSMK